MIITFWFINYPCAESVSLRLRELGILNTAINEITAIGKEIGKFISHMYHVT